MTIEREQIGGGTKPELPLTNPEKGVNIEIDELTPCLIDRKTGEILETDITEIKSIDSSKLVKEGWTFNWQKPFDNNETVKKLTLKGDSEIQGLIAYHADPANLAYYVSIVESNPKNVGINGDYKGVGAHLFAQACLESYNSGYGGFVFFDPVAAVAKHYESTLGAQFVGGTTRMYIDEVAALKLIKEYFGNEK